MAKPAEFEVFIPTTEMDGYDLTVRISAENWMQALKLGLERTGDRQLTVRNILCDIKDDDTVQVTDLSTQRVFRIKRMPEPWSGSQPAVRQPPGARRGSRFQHPREFPVIRSEDLFDPNAGVTKIATSPVQALTPAGTPIVHQKAPGHGTERTKAAAAHSTERTSAAAAKARAAAERVRKARARARSQITGRLGFSDSMGRYRRIGVREMSLRNSRPGVIVREQVTRSADRLTRLNVTDGSAETFDHDRAESAIVEVFLDVNELFQSDVSVERAIDFVLDLSLFYVPAEAGSVLFLTPNLRELFFAQALGPKANPLLEQDIRVPIREGVVGFCTREGVSVAVSEPRRDPRYYPDVAEKLSYPTQSLLCSPIKHDGRGFGALEVLNHREGKSFTPEHMSVISYLGAQLGRFLFQRISA